MRSFLRKQPIDQLILVQYLEAAALLDTAAEHEQKASPLTVAEWQTGYSRFPFVAFHDPMIKRVARLVIGNVLT